MSNTASNPATDLKTYNALLNQIQDFSRNKDVAESASLAAVIFHYVHLFRNVERTIKTFIPVPAKEFGLAGNYHCGPEVDNTLNVIVGRNVGEIILDPNGHESDMAPQNLSLMSFAADGIALGVRGLFRLNANVMVFDISALAPDVADEALRLASQSALAGHIVLLLSSREDYFEKARIMKERHEREDQE